MTQVQSPMVGNVGDYPPALTVLGTSNPWAYAWTTTLTNASGKIVSARNPFHDVSVRLTNLDSGGGYWDNTNALTFPFKRYFRMYCRFSANPTYGVSLASAFSNTWDSTYSPRASILPDGSLAAHSGVSNSWDTSNYSVKTTSNVVPIGKFFRFEAVLGWSNSSSGLTHNVASIWVPSGNGGIHSSGPAHHTVGSTTTSSPGFPVASMVGATAWDASAGINHWLGSGDYLDITCVAISDSGWVGPIRPFEGAVNTLRNRF